MRFTSKIHLHPGGKGFDQIRYGKGRLIFSFRVRGSGAHRSKQVECSGQWSVWRQVKGTDKCPLSSGRKWRGLPKMPSFPRIGLPGQAADGLLTTAWCQEEAARSPAGGAVIDQGLDIRFAVKYTAAGCNGVDRLIILGMKFI